MSENLSKTPIEELVNPFHVRTAYVVTETQDTVQPVFDWVYDEKLHQKVYVQVGEQDFQEIINANAGKDIRSIINRMPGETAMEKFAVAVSQGLAPGVDGDPFAYDPDAGISDYSALDVDPVNRDAIIREGKKNVDKLNKFLGRDANNAFSAEDFLAGKADEIIKEYLEKRIAAAAPQEGVKE